MDGVLGYDFALKGYAFPRKTWANEINFGIHAPSAGLFDRFIDLPSSPLPLYRGCPHIKINIIVVDSYIYG